MDLAEKWLGVPQLVEPQDMVNPKVDEQSMMTYLAQYPNAKLKPGAPIRPKTNSARVRCYGKGLYIEMIISLTDKEGQLMPSLSLSSSSSMNYHSVFFVIHGHLFVTDRCNEKFNGKNREYEIVFV